MKFTIWEKNNIHSLLGSLQISKVSELEMLLNLRKKFKISDEEMANWNRYFKLGARENLTAEQQEFVDGYGARIHNNEVAVPLTKSELKYLSDKVTSDQVRLPSTPELIEKSIAFVQKIKNKQTEEEEI